MKRNLFIFFSVVLCAVLCSFKAQGVPPLKPEYLPIAPTWNADSLPSNLAGFDFGTVEEPATEKSMEERLDEIAGELSEYAASFLGRRYRWGATGPSTFDCSGFTSYVFRKVGISLNRTSIMQYRQGKPVAKDELRPGDLMFFSSPRTSRGVVGHVAIVVDVADDGKSCTFIHASTSKGITYQKFPDGGYFSRAYIGAKRVIDEHNLTA